MTKRRVLLDRAEITEPSEAEEVAKRWDAAMRRAFKGLVLGGRPAARAALMRSPLNRMTEASDADVAAE